MRIHGMRALSWLALAIALPLIPCLSCLAAAPGCALDRPPAGLASPQPRSFSPQPAGGEIPAAECAPAGVVNPAAVTEGGTR